MQNETSNDIRTLEEDVRNLVEQGRDVKEKVRQLTLRLISSTSLDIQNVRKTAEAVLRGARAGVQKDLQHTSAQYHAARENLKQAVAGLDVALAQFAESAKLAVEEAASRAQKYSSEDLKRARADLEKLETMFMDTLQNSAAAAKDTAGEILHDLVAHARTSGSAIGEQLKDTLSVFASQISAAGRAQVDAGLHLAGKTAELMRKTAAGVLSGMADYIRPGQPPEQDQSAHKGE